MRHQAHHSGPSRSLAVTPAEKTLAVLVYKVAQECLTLRQCVWPYRSSHRGESGLMARYGPHESRCTQDDARGSSAEKKVE